MKGKKEDFIEERERNKQKNTIRFNEERIKKEQEEKIKQKKFIKKVKKFIIEKAKQGEEILYLFDIPEKMINKVTEVKTAISELNDEFKGILEFRCEIDIDTREYTKTVDRILIKEVYNNDNTKTND